VVRKFVSVMKVEISNEGEELSRNLAGFQKLWGKLEQRIGGED
jgi:hypothetical protein